MLGVELQNTIQAELYWQPKILCQVSNSLLNLILKPYKTKISAEVRVTGIKLKEKTLTENLLEERDKKIKEAEAEFEPKTLEQSQKAEKEKAAVEDVRKKALETLAETKRR